MIRSSSRAERDAAPRACRRFLRIGGVRRGALPFASSRAALVFGRLMLRRAALVFGRLMLRCAALVFGRLMLRCAAPMGTALLSTALLGCTALACTPTRPLVFATAHALPDEPRRPDGVVVDPRSAPPMATSSTGDTSSSVLALRVPLGTRAAHETIAAFFAGVAAEDPTVLHANADPSATVSDLGTSPPRVLNLVFVWQQRFGKFDYRELAERARYRDADVRTYPSANAHALPRRIQGGVLSEPLGPDDVVLIVPIAAPLHKGERLFGDELTFVLRRTADRFVIAKIVEEVPL